MRLSILPYTAQCWASVPKTTQYIIKLLFGIFLLSYEFLVIRDQSLVNDLPRLLFMLTSPVGIIAALLTWVLRDRSLKTLVPAFLDGWHGWWCATGFAAIIFFLIDRAYGGHLDRFRLDVLRPLYDNTLRRQPRHDRLPFLYGWSWGSNVGLMLDMPTYTTLVYDESDQFSLEPKYRSQVWMQECKRIAYDACENDMGTQLGKHYYEVVNY